MSVLNVDFEGGEVLRPGAGLEIGCLSIAAGRIRAELVGRRVDVSGFLVLPGMVDAHGDGFERHVAPRRGAMPDIGEGIASAEAELAANGITTGVMAQFYSWEGGLRGPDFAAQVLPAITAERDVLMTDLIPQLRFETHMLDHFAALPGLLAEWGVSYVVFNDHLPHDRLSQGRRPKALTGQALKAGRTPETQFELLLDLHANGPEVPAALDRLARVLAAQGVRMGSHDEHSAQDRAEWRARGVHISEFPETEAAARAAREGGDAVILGAPNVSRGGSHKGNVSAAELVRLGLCDALASDYHYPSLRRAALRLWRDGICDFATAWGLVSDGPARLLGLDDRGRLVPGQRADIVLLDKATLRVAATLCAGRVSYLSGALAARFLA